MRLPESAIPAIALRFEELRGRRLDALDMSEIIAHGLQESNPELLSRELRHLIDSESKSDLRDRGLAYWALGKKQDQALLPYFRSKLSLELRRDMFAVHQILIALDDLGERPFGSDRSCYGCHDDELNRSDAEAYLQRSATP